MSKLMVIHASPRGRRSRSNQVADGFVDVYRDAHPHDEIESFNVFDLDLPPFDGPALQAKYNIMHQQESTAEQKQDWQRVEAIIEHFKNADKYVFALPMWNFGIPYQLKHYFDILVQPTYTFSFDPETGYTGLVTGCPAVAIYARGGDYRAPEAAHMDFQKSYLELILGFIGFTDITSVIIEPTLAGTPEVMKERFDEALDQAQAIAASF